MRRQLSNSAKYLEARRKVRTCKRLRSHLCFFGFPGGDVSDDELQNAVVQMGKMIANSGMTTKQAVEGMRRLGKVTP